MLVEVIPVFSYDITYYAIILTGAQRMILFLQMLLFGICITLEYTGNILVIIQMFVISALQSTTNKHTVRMFGDTQIG